MCQTRLFGESEIAQKLEKMKKFTDYVSRLSLNFKEALITCWDWGGCEEIGNQSSSIELAKDSIPGFSDPTPSSSGVGLDSIPGFWTLFVSHHLTSNILMKCEVQVPLAGGGGGGVRG